MGVCLPGRLYDQNLVKGAETTRSAACCGSRVSKEPGERDTDSGVGPVGASGSAGWVGWASVESRMREVPRPTLRLLSMRAFALR